MTTYAKYYGIITESTGNNALMILGPADKDFNLGIDPKLVRNGVGFKYAQAFNVGDIVSFLLKGTNKSVKIHSRLSIVNTMKELQMSGYFVAVKFVNSDAPQNMVALGKVIRGGVPVIKAAWLKVANLGAPAVIPHEFADFDDAMNFAQLIDTTSNGKSAVVDSNGKEVAIPIKPIAPVPAPVSVPAKVDVDENFFLVEEDAAFVLSYVAAQQKASPKHINVMLTGETGTGKTTLAQTFARKLGYSCHRINCSLVAEPSDMFGQREIVNGATVWGWSETAKAISAGNTVIILDEINRAYPNVMNGLFSLLDNDGEMWLGSELLKVGPNTVFIATINQGSKYTGTFEADDALMNRFPLFVELGNLSEKQMATILQTKTGVGIDESYKIVRFADNVNLSGGFATISIRTMENVARMVAGGMTIRQAFQFAYVTHVPGNYRKEATDFVNRALGPLSMSFSSIF